MSESNSGYASERGTYRGEAVVEIDETARKRGGFLAEFTDANDADRDDENPETIFYITYSAIADNEYQAYRRIANLIEARAAIGGYSGHFSIKSIDDIRQVA